MIGFSNLYPTLAVSKHFCVKSCSRRAIHRNYAAGMTGETADRSIAARRFWPFVDRSAAADDPETAAQAADLGGLVAP